MSDEIYNELLKKIECKSARIGIIGLGYVGLPLVMELCNAGFFVDGYDVSEKKVELLSKGGSDIDDIAGETVQQYIDRGTFFPSTNPSILSSDDVILICVPTPLSRFREPDTSYIEDAVEKVAAIAHPGLLVVLESTTYPGTTNEIIAPKLAEKGFVIGEDIFIAFSPERVDPGNPTYHTGNTPKIVGGVTSRCTNAAVILYLSFLDKVIPVSSTAAAEMVKLLENTFRSVNIALVNEMAMICDRLGLDVWEIIDAAATKPFGFMPFYPGPGVGGHCIPIDPHYLSWKLKALNFYAHFIELAGEVNYRMPNRVIDGIVRHLNEHGKSLKDSTVLVLGVAYKNDISDVRESPALDIMKLLIEWGANVLFNDPYVPSLRWDDDTIGSCEISEDLLSSVDIVVLTTNHTIYDCSFLAQHAKLIYDTRNAFAGIADTDGKIATLGSNR